MRLRQAGATPSWRPTTTRARSLRGGRSARSSLPDRPSMVHHLLQCPAAAARYGRHPAQHEVPLDIEEGYESEDENKDEDEVEEADVTHEDEDATILPSTAEALLRQLDVSADEAAEMEEVTLDGIALSRGDLEAYTLPSLFPVCRALGLQDMGWEAGDITRLCTVLQGFPSLKAVWLNGNPVCRDAEAMARLNDTAEAGGWEILNRRLTANYGMWALIYLSDAQAPADLKRLDLRRRGLTTLKEEVLRELCNLEMLDVRGNRFEEVGGGLETALLPALRELPRLVSLRVDVGGEEARRIASEVPSLVWLNAQRVVRTQAGVRLAQEEGGRGAEGVDEVIRGMWALVEPMRVAVGEGHHPELYWYVMDTPGLGVCHSVTPNLRMAALREPRLGLTFSAFWPIKDIRPGDRLTRDFLDGFPPLSSGAQSLLLRAIWGSTRPFVLTDTGAVSDLPPPPITAPSIHTDESKATREEGGGATLVYPTFSEASGRLRVWSDMPVLQQYLKHPRFHFTEDATAADILWTAGAVPRQHAGQYMTTLPGLQAVDDKCGMARLLREEGPDWDGIPQTFCFPEDLEAFLATVPMDSRQAWIVKPPHLARGWDIVVTASVAGVLRHLQASDRLSVSAYVSDPDIHRGHKYDLRLYCLLLGTRKVLIHEHFRIRVAGQPYSSTRLEDVNVHLTNTTLGSDGKPAETLSKQAFTEGFAQAHGDKPWGLVYDNIVALLQETFRRLTASTAFREDEPKGRALVGVDVLLDSNLKPWLIEINASPNCLGLCAERPDFFDQVFEACFVETDGDIEKTGFSLLVERS